MPTKLKAGTIVGQFPRWSGDSWIAALLAAGDIPALDAAKVVSGILDAARIPDLDADKITTGEFDVARIPDLSAAKITSGTLDGDILPAMSTTKKGGVPGTGAPSGKFLKDDGTFAAVSGMAVHGAEYHDGDIVPAADQDFGGYRLQGLKRMTSVPVAADIGTDGLVLTEISTPAGSVTDTIGDTSHTDGETSAYIRGFPLVASDSGTLDTLGINLSAYTGHIRLGLYSTYSGGKFSGLLGQSASTVAVSGWNDLSIGAGIPILATRTYYPVIEGDAAYPNIGAYYAAAGTWYYVVYTYGAFPDPTNTLTTASNFAMNMRIKYTKPATYVRRLYANVNGTVVSVALA
jgi:hypothetical protein